MSKFKLIDENGVEWVKVTDTVYQTVATNLRTNFVTGTGSGNFDWHYYAHPDGIPKPKDRFEEMAEKAIMTLESWKKFIGLKTPEGDHWISIYNPCPILGDGMDVIRRWFASHARAIDADATERERKAEREFIINLMNDGPLSGGRIHARMSKRIDELSK